MTEGSIARRYARALLELAREGNVLDRVEADLAGFIELCEGDLGAVMATPVYTQAERRAVLDVVLPRLGVLPLSQNFLRLLLDKERIGAIVDIHREFRALADVEAGRVRATVTTAFPLEDTMTREVTAALSASTGEEVVVSTRVDPALLGGLVAQVGSRAYDASLRTRLEQIQLTLAAPVRA